MEILSGRQGRLYKRSQTLSTFLTEEEEVYSEYEPFKNEVSLYFNNHKQLVALISGKDVNGKGITTGKDALKDAVAKEAAAICVRATAYAIKKGDTDLQNAVNHSYSSVLDLKDSEVLGFATRLSTVITPLLTDPIFATYAVTKNMVDSLTKGAENFNSNIGKATLVNAGRGYASRSINKIFKAIYQNIIQFNLLINFFEDTEPEFVNNYHIAAAIDDTGIHHTGIKGIIRGANDKPVHNAVITGEGKKKVAKSDKLGAYELVKIKPGLRTFTITADGYQPQEILLPLQRGKIQDCNLTLSPKVGAMSATA